MNGTVDEWLAALAGPGALGGLLGTPREEQLRRGYGHTLREIVQQPITWIETAARMRERAPVIAESTAGAAAIVLTGSGSSIYAAECVAPYLQSRLAIPVSAVPAGLILTHPDTCLPPSGPFLVVSLARSGDSPESRAVVDCLLEERPQARHLFLTCNRHGALATGYRDRPGVRAIVLDEKTDDRSLVMTSSFTNLVLAGRSPRGRAGGRSSAHPGAGRRRRSPAARAGRRPGRRSRAAATGPSSTSAAAAASAPPARRRSRCWR